MRPLHLLVASLAVIGLGSAPAARAQSTAATPSATSTTAASAAAAPTTTICLADDAACRVQHNDSAVLGQKLDTLHTDVQQLIQVLQSVAATPAAGSTAAATTTTGSTAAAGATTTSTTAAAAPALIDPCASGAAPASWTTYKATPTINISAALACAGVGFHLALEPGVYDQVFHVPDGLSPWDIGGDTANGGNADTVKVDGQGGCTVAQNNGSGCPTRLAWGKGVIHISSPGTIHDIEVRHGGSNATGDHDGQAGIYLDAGADASGAVLIQNVMVRDNENGVFENTSASFDLTMTTDDFVGNGTDGGSHSSYISGGKTETLNNIQDYGSNLGNDQKSRVPVVNVNGGFFQSVQGRWIDAADGATVTIVGGTFIGNTCCQNVFGNGDESQTIGPGNTSWTGSTMWLGRPSDFMNHGTFNASNITLTCAAGASAFDDLSGAPPLTGLPSCPSTASPAPASPPFISGAKS